MTKVEQKRIALNAYQKAKATGQWERAAKLLKQAFVPAPRVPKVRKIRKGKCIYPFPCAVAKFSDGEIVRMMFWSQIGMPLDWGRAKKLCENGYHSRTGKNPIIVNLSELHSGEICSA